MSVASRLVAVLAAPLITVPLAAGAQAVTVPRPPTKSLPIGLDIAPPYIGQRICDPTPKPGVIAFAQLMVSHYGTGTSAWGISRNCNSGVTEHSEGRALDWMLSINNPQQRAIADSVTQWLSAPDAQGRPGAMARRFGIMYIIWNRHMWRAYDPARGWAPYVGDSPHTDHVHFSFTWDGAYKRTSWWTGVPLTTYSTGPSSGTSTSPVTPPTSNPTSYPVLSMGVTGSDVALAQKVVGVPADGQFGPVTMAALRTWQSRNRVPVTGRLDAATWARMVALGKVPARGVVVSGLAAYAHTTLRLGSNGPAVVALQKALGGLSADGQFGPMTDARVRAYQRSKGLTANGIVATSTWEALMGKAPGMTPTVPTTPSVPSSVTTPYTSLLSTTLRVGSSGSAVSTLQRALGGVLVDGAFGSRTAAAVAAFQKAKHLSPTGVVDRAVWLALQTRDYPLLAYRNVVLKRGSTGSAVVALQRALKIGSDGEFGPLTEQAVKIAQARAKLAQTGVVAAVTWQAIERQLTGR